MSHRNVKWTLIYILLKSGVYVPKLIAVQF